MLAVIFEALPAEGKREEYLNIASLLKPSLEQVEGFISIERFQSINNPEKILSLSFWQDEKNISAWRNLEMHRTAQAMGRADVFQHYRLRVAEVKRDYSIDERSEAPADSKLIHKQ